MIGARLSLLPLSASIAIWAPAAPAAPAAPTVALANSTCMSATARGANSSRTFSLPVDANKAASLQSRGFSTRSCTQTAKDFERFEENMCIALYRAPLDFQRKFSVTYGIKLEELCRHALTPSDVEGK